MANRTSTQKLRKRVRYHYRGNAAGSTLRLTLGCLLGLELRRVGSIKRMTFGKAGEATLSQWMADNARVCWIEQSEPWDLESQLTPDQQKPRSPRSPARPRARRSDLPVPYRSLESFKTTSPARVGRPAGPRRRRCPVGVPVPTARW
ncbi:GIY-YIG nuclease family protein [Streptomyces sp. NPDC053069]|uniref:GIY-YIG nuclease family protein n=1 Tax=Streptomyces sp. NPDC053069 TaxID=3365695 RepID=UPI0037D91D01